MLVDQVRIIDEQKNVKKLGQLSRNEKETLKNVAYETFV